jgi:hypothetical protein
MRLVMAVIALVWLGAAPGASFAQRGMVPPRVTVQSLEPLPSDGAGQRFRAVMRVDNMHTEPVKLRGIEFSLRLAHLGIIDGAIPALTVEALDQQVVTLELQSEIIGSLSQLLSFVQGPESTLPYEIVTKIRFARGRLDPMTLVAEGEVPLVMTGGR